MDKTQILFEKLSKVVEELQQLDDEEIDEFVANKDNEGKGFIVIITEQPVEISDEIKKTSITQTKAISWGSFTEQQLIGFVMNIQNTQNKLLLSLAKRKGLAEQERYKKF